MHETSVGGYSVVSVAPDGNTFDCSAWYCDYPADILCGEMLGLAQALRTARDRLNGVAEATAEGPPVVEKVVFFSDSVAALRLLDPRVKNKWLRPIANEGKARKIRDQMYDEMAAFPAGVRIELRWMPRNSVTAHAQADKFAGWAHKQGKDIWSPKRSIMDDGCLKEEQQPSSSIVEEIFGMRVWVDRKKSRK